MNKTMLKVAQKVLTPVVRKTPLNDLSNLVKDFRLYVKLENLQYTGSYKIRGAYNKMASLTSEERSLGVIAASAGNHAQGVAYAAKAMGVKATIVMPTFAPLSKIAATKELGAEVVLYGTSFDEAYAYSKELKKQTGATFIEPFNDEKVIAGQATVGLEILKQLPQVDIVLVPIGGGGLASGVAYAIKQEHPNCKIIGVESSGANAMKLSMEQCCVVKIDSAKTIADGIAVKCPGDITFKLCQKYLDGIVLVNDDEIVQTSLILLEKAKIVTEGAGAIAVAAALFKKVNLEGKNVVAVISGGNVDVNFLEQIIDRALILQGRKVALRVMVLDRPGALQRCLSIIAEGGANIISVNHDRSGHGQINGYCEVELTLETNNQEHVQKIVAFLEEKGYKPNVKCGF